jgi:CheY-like chemotaxis protein
VVGKNYEDLHRKAMKILIVDDEEIHLLLTKLELQDERCEVIAATNGQEAMELFENEKPDLAIVDVKMPGMDGVTLLKKMKERRPEIPVALFTGYDQKALTIPDEADAFLVKSSSYKELKEFVRRYAQKE